MGLIGFNGWLLLKIWNIERWGKGREMRANGIALCGLFSYPERVLIGGTWTSYSYTFLSLVVAEF